MKLLCACVFLALSLNVLAARGARASQASETEGLNFRNPEANRNPDAAATLIVFNQNDPDSRDLANFYAEKRGIPRDHLLGLRCAINEEISREDYDRTIAEPLRRFMTANFFWKLRELNSPLGAVEWNKIRFIALMRGVPLKIAPAVAYAGDKPTGPEAIATHNEAAVDSELSIVGLRTPIISGALNNPYFRSYSRIRDYPSGELMLVCRIDAPTYGIARRMITDSLEAEQEGLAGFTYIDARGINDGGYLEGDQWLRAAAENARRRGSPVILDDGPDLFPAGYPMRNAAVYLGWYSGDVSGALASPGFRFVRGAVAVHIHSFSAATVRDPSQHWVGPLLFAGAAATLGNVYEPYLSLTPHLDILHERLRAGFTFAESAYMAQRYLSWMTTFVGDPLYRPFKGAEMLDEKPAKGEWAEYREGAKLWFTKSRAVGEAALRASAKRLRSGAIYEGLGLLEITVNDRAAALTAFQQARSVYTNADDVCRVAIHEAIQLRGANREADAIALARKMIAAYPRSPAVSVLQLFEPPKPK